MRETPGGEGISAEELGMVPPQRAGEGVGQKARDPADDGIVSAAALTPEHAVQDLVALAEKGLEGERRVAAFGAGEKVEEARSHEAACRASRFDLRSN